LGYRVDIFKASTWFDPWPWFDPDMGEGGGGIPPLNCPSKMGSVDESPPPPSLPEKNLAPNINISVVCIMSMKNELIPKSALDNHFMSLECSCVISGIVSNHFPVEKEISWSRFSSIFSSFGK
jgi:hypothetical protein